MSEESGVDGGGEAGGEGGGQEVQAVEREARMFGWRPQEEFNGPEEKWKPASEFLEEGKRINGFLRKDMDKLKAEIHRRDSDIAELRSTISQFAQFHHETEARTYQRVRDELLNARKEALRENDGERVVEIEERIGQLGAPPTPPQMAPQPQGPDPVWVAWVEENTWFAENPKLRAIANGYGDVVRRENPKLVGRPFLEEVKRMVQSDFPEHFESRRRAATVSGSGETRGGTGRKTFADLPAEAKEACDKFIRQKLIPNRETYVREFFGE